ncbi:MAG: transglycosylase SLT domain-containing protein [Dokdonella sp.]
MRSRGLVRVALLATGISLLAGCAAPSPRPSPAPAPAPVAPLAPTVADIAPAAAPAVTSPDVPANSPWPRLRQRFVMQRCDYRPQVMRWANYYSKSPRQFRASWKQAMPFLLLVVDELNQRELPGEFAMLPYVESSYQPLPSKGDRPAGMWQLVPDTAREAGLVVGSDYDGRLDAIASTAAALDLLTRYQREFADWRLANMAFNSGEYKVRKLLGDRDARSLSADDLANLSFQPWTHDHLDRLLALSCIVEDPQRFGVELPEPTDEDRLQAVKLETGMDLRLAARLAGLDVDEVKRWNAGYRRNRMSMDSTRRLLLPATHVERFTTAAATVPVTLWSDWREQRAASTSSLATWAAQAGIPVAVLAAANATSEQTTIASSSRLLLPGREAEPPADRAEAQRSSRMHVVVAGDTLSRIAHHYDIPLKELRRRNPGANGTLHLGEHIRLDIADAH